MLSVGKFRSLGPMPNDRGELLVQQDIDLGTNVASPVLNVAQEAFEVAADDSSAISPRGLRVPMLPGEQLKSLAVSLGTPAATDAKSLPAGSASQAEIYASSWLTSRGWGVSAASTHALTDPSARFTPPCRRFRPSREVAWPASPPS